MIYPKNFEEKLGFIKIRTNLKEHCLSDLGKSKVDGIAFSVSFRFIREQLLQVNEFKHIILFEEAFPITHFVDVRPSLNKIKAIGSCFETAEVYDLKRSLENIRAILQFFSYEDEPKYLSLTTLTKDIVVYPYILDSINAIIDKYGIIKDNASPELLKLRRQIQENQRKVSITLQKVLKQAKSNEYLEPDAAATFRNGRSVIPVPAKNKRKLAGYIHDESATGKTVFIEPAELVEINNEIKDLEYAERREIIKILVALTDAIRPYADALLQAYDFLASIDFIRAKALFAIDTGSIMPVMEDKQFFNWKAAKHPLLYLAYKHENREVVPLDIALDHENRILVISGPNAGGKSVCLQTVGLLQYMLQCGLLIPMHENSETGIFNHIFINIGDEQSIENDLSTYSSQLINMKFFHKQADHHTLLLIDEFGSGTEPMMGGAIAEALLEKFNEKKAFGVITTHYTNLKHFAESKKGIINGAMLFDTHHIEPLFKLQIGEPGSSFAFEIARKTGISEEILKDATQKLGRKHIDFDKNLKDIIRDKRYYADKRQSIRQKEKHLEKLIRQYSNDLYQLEKSRKDILKKYEAEAKATLEGINKKIENTIQEIRNTQAEKEITRQLRKDLEDYKQSHIKQSKETLSKLENKINRLEEKRQVKDPQAKTGEQEATARNRSGKETERAGRKALQVGDKVKIEGQESVGEVLEIKRKKALIAFGNIKTMLDMARLTKISQQEFSKLVHLKHPVVIRDHANGGGEPAGFTPNLDIRGKRADDALQELADFMDRAMMSDYRELRILHGKGNGILRQMTRDYLKTLDAVSSFQNEHEESGGAGITVARLE